MTHAELKRKLWSLKVDLASVQSAIGNAWLLVCAYDTWKEDVPPHVEKMVESVEGPMRDLRRVVENAMKGTE